MTENKFPLNRPKKSFNFNSERFRRKMTDIGKPRRKLNERIFPKHKKFWWKRTHHGGYGSRGYTNYEFKSSNLAIIISILSFIFLLTYILIS